MPRAFIMVDVKGHYNMLLRQDWIDSNECVPSTLHQCVIQWIADEVEVVQADEEVCVAVAKSQVDISIGKDGFVTISVKPTIGATWLAHDL
jgi:hypothetical protein